MSGTLMITQKQRNPQTNSTQESIQNLGNWIYCMWVNIKIWEDQNTFRSRNLRCGYLRNQKLGGEQNSWVSISTAFEHYSMLLAKQRKH